MSNFEAFNNMVDMQEVMGKVEELKSKSGGVDFTEDLPDGRYIFEMLDMELGTTNAGDKPMLKLRFKVAEGEWKGKYVFINKVMFNGSTIFFANKLLAELAEGSGIEPEFEGDFSKYNEIVEQVKFYGSTVKYEVDFEMDNGWSTIKEIVDVISEGDNPMGDGFHPTDEDMPF